MLKILIINGGQVTIINFMKNGHEIKQAVIEVLDFNEDLPRTKLQDQFRTEYKN